MKYKGHLAKPITKKKVGLFDDEESVKAEESRIFDARAAKMVALFAAHGVEAGNWVALSFELAKEYVPGFRVAEPAGRPTEWGVLEKAELKLAVDRMREANPGMKITDAIRRVQRMDSWQVKIKDMKVEALSKHYYSADPTWTAIVRDAQSWNELSGGIVSQE